MSRSVRLSLCSIAGLVTLSAFFGGYSSAAVTPVPHWDGQIVAKPTNFKVGPYSETSDAYEVVISNIGGAPSIGPSKSGLSWLPD